MWVTVESVKINVADIEKLDSITTVIIMSVLS
jgi:hypothetical protein